MAQSPEVPPGGGEKAKFMDRLKELLHKVLRKKKDGEVIKQKEVKKKHDKGIEHVDHQVGKETRDQRIKAEEARLEREARKPYQQRKTTLDTIDEASLADARSNIEEEKAQNAREHITRAILQIPDVSGATGYEESSYLFKDYEGDSQKAVNQQERLVELLEVNNKVALVLGRLTDPRRKSIHGEPFELINQAENLIVLTPREYRDAILPVVNAVRERINSIIWQKYKVDLQKSRVQISPEEWLIAGMKHLLTDEMRDLLDPVKQNDNQAPIKNFKTVLDRILDVDQAAVKDDKALFERDISLEPGLIPRSVYDPTSDVWEKYKELRRRRGKSAEGKDVPLDNDDVKKLNRELEIAERQAYPKDSFPGSKEWQNSVSEVHKAFEGRRNVLAEELRASIREESVPVEGGITDSEEFLKQFRRPEYFESMLMQSPAMYELFIGNSKESQKFRDRVFLKIHAGVLSQKRESANDNFGLYERAGFIAFQNFIREGLSDYIDPERGKSLGQIWIDWYTGLSSTIRLSRDIDYQASMPGANMEQFNRILGVFQNEYSAQALSLPAVEQAYRSYESALKMIRDANDGYIPPALVEYDPVNHSLFWDDSAERMLEHTVAMGEVYDVERNEASGLPVVDEDGHTVKLSKTDKLTGMDPLERQMYMTLAKGFGMASLRFLEIVANSKVPGSGAEGFHSPVFENAAIGLNFWNLFMRKWSAGGYKYYYMANALLPTDKKLPPGEGSAQKVYEARMDGTFEKKYGKTAKNILDYLNFSVGTSSFGPPGTSWRLFDTSLGWTDLNRQKLGGPTRVMMAGRIAAEKLKNHKFVDHYKEEFRQAKTQAGEPAFGREFEHAWIVDGMKIYKDVIDHEWEHFKHHDHHHAEEEVDNLKRAYIARVWAETIMRNPQAIAEAVHIEVPIKGYESKGYKKRMLLKNYIFEQVLGIKYEDLMLGSAPEYDDDGNFTGKYKIIGAKHSSPTKTQLENLRQVMALESDIAVVKERAIREGRDLTENDFRQILRDPARLSQALEYWRITREVMLGSDSLNACREIYPQLGIVLEEGEHDYTIDWHKIDHSEEKIFSKLSAPYAKRPYSLLSKDGVRIDVGIPKLYDLEFIDRDWEWLFSTDDVAFRELAMLNLGSRQWLRRGGDAAAHLAGGQEIANYFDATLVPDPNPEDLAKHIMKIRQAYAGDDVNVGWRAGAHIAYLTSKLYESDLRQFGSSVAQRDVWKTRRNVASWNANNRRKFWDALEHIDALPPHGHYPHFELPFPDWNIHDLRKANNADNSDVWKEIIMWGILLSLALTIYKALSAPSEEDSGGGGGHH